MLLPFIIYAITILIIACISYRRHTNEADFVVGGRSLNFWITAISAHASDMSSWIFLGYPVMVFTQGLSYAWVGLGLFIGMFLNWQYIAPRLRIMTETYNSLTLSSFFEAKYNDHTGFIRIITALICLLFFTFYISSGLQGIGYLFETSFGISYELGVFLGLLIAILYTVIGGFITIAWTDFFQGLFLVAMIFLVPAVAFIHIGGFAAIESSAATNHISLSLFPTGGFKSWLELIFLILAMGPGYFGQPHILTKFMGIKNPSDIYKSKYFGMSWQLIVLASAVFVGLTAIGFFPEGTSEPTLIFATMTKLLFHPFIAGLVLCGILAATVSTIDSQILVQASLLSEDFYKKIFRPKATSRELLWASRFFVALVGLFSYLIARNNSATIYDLVMYSWSGLGASFGPIMILSLYSKSVNRHGAVAAILVGAFTAATWQHVNKLFSVSIPELIPAFLLSLCAAWFFSYLARKKTTRYEV